MDFNELLQYGKTLIPYIFALVSAIISLLVCRIQSKEHKEKEKILKQQLERAKSRETYTKCPKCGARIPLSEVNFYLPGDIRDNNLNGVDDGLE